MKRTLLGFLCFVTALSLLTGVALAQAEGRKNPAGGEKGTKKPVARAGHDGAMMMEKLDLTEQQKEAIKKIMADAKAESEKAEGREAKAKIFKDAREKIMSTVLTEEQRKKLADLMKELSFRMYAKLGLTDQQKEKIDAIMGKAHEDAKKADTPKARHDIIEAARKTIMDEVLTKEQQDKMMEKMRRSRGPAEKGAAKGAEKPSEE